MVALPVRRSSLMMSSERWLIEVDISRGYFLSGSWLELKPQMGGNFHDSFKRMIKQRSYDHI
jgi:hypothetical protein